MKRAPWVTLSLSLLAVAIHFFPAAGNVLQFDRAAVARGQVWRFFTAHLTHFGDDHLRWDLIAFAALGAMAEHMSRRTFALSLGFAAAAITAGVWLCQPQFATYRGLSGLDSALYGLVVAHTLSFGIRGRHGLSIVAGAAALAGFSAKCAFELATGGTVFVDAAGTFAPVPFAHLLGLATGAGVYSLNARFNRRESCAVPTACNVPSSVTSSTSGA